MSRPSILSRAPAIALAVAAVAFAAQADYRVGRGDVLTVAVLEAPSIARLAKVDADGRIVLPMLGEVDAAGADLAAIRARIEQALIARGIVLRPTVLVEVASYRPFYVGGAVRTPGQVEFTPGLTVRHALILAGGATGAVNGTDPEAALERATQWRIATDRLADLDSRIARLEAELRDDPQAMPADGAGARASGDAASSAGGLRAIDATLLRDSIDAQQAEEAHLRRTLVLIDLEIGVLAEQARLQGEEQALQRQEVDGVRSLQDKGLAPLQRVQGLEREASRLRRDMLDNQAFSARARLNRAAVDHQIRALRVDRRIAVTSELREAVLERGQIASQVDLLRTQLQAAGLSVGETGLLRPPVAQVTIHRAAEDGSRVIDADLDTELAPGDILDVALRRPEAG